MDTQSLDPNKNSITATVGSLGWFALYSPISICDAISVSAQDIESHLLGLIRLIDPQALEDADLNDDGLIDIADLLVLFEACP